MWRATPKLSEGGTTREPGIFSRQHPFRGGSAEGPFQVPPRSLLLTLTAGPIRRASTCWDQCLSAKA